MLRGFLVAAIIAAVALLLTTCGGGRKHAMNHPSIVSDSQHRVPPAFQPVIDPSLESALAELDAYPCPEGVDEELWGELKDALADALNDSCRMATFTGGTGVPPVIQAVRRRDACATKLISTPPTGADNRVNDLTIIDNGGTYTLSWHYRNLGDYDQNGIIGISDITPIAMHYGETYELTDVNCLLAVIDGSSNGVVDIADITPIAMCYATDCGGYRIQGGNSPDGEFASFRIVSVEEATGSGRLSFSTELTSVAHLYLRVVPYNALDEDGEPSDPVLVPGDPPEIVSVSPTSGMEDEVVQFSAEVTGSGSFAYAWDFGGGADPDTSVQASPSVTLGAVGEYSASLTVSNAFGADDFPFTLTVNPAPPEILSVSPTEGLEGTSVQFSAEVTGTEPFAYAWDFGGGADPNVSDDATPTVTLSEDGEYSAKLTVSNSAGDDIFPFVLNVEPGFPPEITDVQPTEGFTGQDVTFAATVSGTAPLNYDWSFGGGATPNISSETNPEATLGDQGMYSANLTVTNLYGEDSFPFELQVLEPGWHLEIVDPDTQGWYNSLAFDPDGNPAISYFYSTDADLRFAWWNGESWDIEDIDTEGCTAHDTSLAFDGDGYPCISYYSYAVKDLKVAWWDGSEWDVKTIDSEGSCGAGNSLAINENGNPIISYGDPDSGGLKLAKWNDTDWEFETVATDAVNGTQTSLAFDLSWNPAVAYTDTNYAEPNLRFAWWHDSEWHDELIDGADIMGAYSSLAFDDTGSPAISYEGLDNALKFAHWNGSDWDIETVEGEEWVEGQTSLAFDGSGYPLICYHIVSMNQLMLARWDGTGWDKESIDTGASSQGYCSLVFDMEGNPAISYARDPVLKLARWY